MNGGTGRAGWGLPWQTSARAVARAVLLLTGLAGLDAGALGQPLPPAPPPAIAGFVAPLLLELPDIPFPAGVPYEPHDVVVDILIDETGRPIEISTVSGEEPFLTLTMEGLTRARFQPATDDGEPVAVTVPFTWAWSPPPVTVSGVLHAKGGLGSAEGILVRVGGQTATTDERGAFALRAVEPGHHTVEVLTAGWFLPETTFDLVAGEAVDLDLWVVGAGGEHEAVGFYARAQDAIIRRTVTRDDIRVSPGTMGDPVRALQNQPSIMRTPLEAGWILVRGGSADDTAVFIDGVQVPLLFHLGGFTSVLHPELIDKVVLYPNAYPARLGNATSGAVELTPRKVGEDERSVAGVNLVHASAFAEVPLGDDGGLAVAARRSYIDGVLALALGSDRAGIAPRFWDWQARVESRAVGLMLIGMSDAIDTPTGNGDETVRVIQSGWLLVGRATARFGTRTRLDIRPTYTHQEHDLETQLLREQEYRASSGLRADLAGPLGAAGSYIAGAEGRLWNYRITRAAVGRSVPIGSAAPYAEVTLGEEVQATVGVRGDVLTMSQQLPRTGISPRGVLRWQAARAWSLLAEVGQYHQFPPFVVAAGLPEGPYIRMERSFGPSAGVHYATAKAAVDADAYVRQGSRIAAFETDGSLAEGDARAYGFELAGQIEPGRTDLRMVYQYSRSLFREQPGALFTPYLFDQPHRVLLLGAYRLPREWTLAARFRYSSGFPIVGGVDSAFDILTQQEIAFSSEAERLAPYHSIDFKASKRFLSRKWVLDAYLDVQNLYGRRVAEPVINGFDESKPVYGYGLPTLPIFGVEAVIRP